MKLSTYSINRQDSATGSHQPLGFISIKSKSVKWNKGRLACFTVIISEKLDFKHWSSLTADARPVYREADKFSDFQWGEKWPADKS